MTRRLIFIASAATIFMVIVASFSLITLIIGGLESASVALGVGALAWLVFPCAMGITTPYDQ